MGRTRWPRTPDTKHGHEERGDLDRLGERMRGLQTTLLATNLTDAEHNVLLETFGGA